MKREWGDNSVEEPLPRFSEMTPMEQIKQRKQDHGELPLSVKYGIYGLRRHVIRSPLKISELIKLDHKRTQSILESFRRTVNMKAFNKQMSNHMEAIRKQNICKQRLLEEAREKGRRWLLGILRRKVIQLLEAENTPNNTSSHISNIENKIDLHLGGNREFTHENKQGEYETIIQVLESMQNK